MAILIQPRDLRAMVRGWTPGMTPRNHSLPRQKKFRHDNTDPSHGYDQMIHNHQQKNSEYFSPGQNVSNYHIDDWALVPI